MGATRIIWLAAIAAVTACGGGSSQIKAGSMPQGATFYGVWQSPQYGNMHICQSGKAVIGDYVKHERYGRIQGAATGDLIRFEWEDRRELVSGRPMVRRGKGYFRISIGEDGDQYLTGEWGFEDDETGGGPWNAVKLRRGLPDRCIEGSLPDAEPEVQEKSWDDDAAEVDVAAPKE